MEERVNSPLGCNINFENNKGKFEINFQNSDEIKNIEFVSQTTDLNVNSADSNFKIEPSDTNSVDDCKTTDENKKKLIKEGKARILNNLKNVFYNPVQEFNRDLSVLAITVFAEDHVNVESQPSRRGIKRKAGHSEEKDTVAVLNSELNASTATPQNERGIVILEALSATGLRSIRYAKEIPYVKRIVANDLSKAAVESIKENAEYNNVTNLIETTNSDASLLMYMRKSENKLFDVIDLDPYGCPSRFLDSAVQCIADGGILLITCTDMAVLAGNSPETCYVKYGAISLRNSACHEMALRIVLQCIESHANRYGRYIVPQLSFSADFYIRVIVKVFTSPAACKRTTSKLSSIYQCAGCQTVTSWPLGVAKKCNNNNFKYNLARGPPISQECAHCGYTFYQGGPIWSDPLHNLEFVEKMLSKLSYNKFNTARRMEGMLELIKEELADSILYYTIDSICSKVHCEVIPRNKFVSAIMNLGYSVSLSHAAPNSIKTNAPAEVIWDIIRCWVEEHPVNPKRLDEGSVAKKILSIPPKTRANFQLNKEIFCDKKKILRYQQNPQRFWGPGTRDKNNCSSNNKMDKSYLNQNKNTKKKSKNHDETGKFLQNTEMPNDQLADKELKEATINIEKSSPEIEDSC